MSWEQQLGIRTEEARDQEPRVTRTYLSEGNKQESMDTHAGLTWARETSMDSHTELTWARETNRTPTQDARNTHTVCWLLDPSPIRLHKLLSLSGSKPSLALPTDECALTTENRASEKSPITFYVFFLSYFFCFWDCSCIISYLSHSSDTHSFPKGET